MCKKITCFLGFVLAFFISVPWLSSASMIVKGDGDLKKEIRKLPVFSKIEIRGVFDVELVCQKEQKMEITAEKNLMPHITTTMKGNILVIDTNKKIKPTTKTLQISISLENLEKILVSGAAQVKIKNVKNKNLAVIVNGAANLSVIGETKDLALETFGAAAMDARGLKAENVNVSLSGAGNADVYAKKNLMQRLQE